MTNSILTTLYLLTICLQMQGQHTSVIPNHTNITDKIDSIVTAYLTKYNMVGVSIGIVKDDNIYYAIGYGTREFTQLKPVDSVTNFLACSITKLFTATAIMQLSEQGKIDISKKLIFYLPDFKMQDIRYQDITIEQMLTPSSGLYWDMELKHSPNDSNALKQLVYSLDDKILDFAPGTQFDATKTYSNAAYDILGYLVQKISGEQYEDYIRENILLKTNMTFSGFNYLDIPSERRSLPHILKGKKVKVGGMYTENTEHTPSANLNSCSRDLCYWMLNVLSINNDVNSFNAILKDSTLNNMWTSRHIAPQNESISIGLGWFITESENLGKYYWHVGGNPGFSSTIMIFPEYNFGITMLSNQQYAQEILWNKIPFDIIELFHDEWNH